MFRYFQNSLNAPERPDPHDPVIDRVVADLAGLHNNHRGETLKEIHERVPRTYWGYWFESQRFHATARYRWKDENWQEVEKTDMPIFELIKYSPML